MNLYFLFIFESIHKVMKTESLFVQEAVVFDIIPTPKEYSSDCGMAIRIRKKNIDIEKIKVLLNKNGIAYKLYEN